MSGLRHSGRNGRGMRSASVPSRLGALGRALCGGAFMGVALGAGTAVGPVVSEGLGVGGFVARLVPAVLVSALALPAVLYALRVRRRSLGDIGFGDVRGGLRSLGVGAGVTGGAAVLVFGSATAAGWMRWPSPDLAALAGFLVTNGVVALLLEALPEETTLRGYAWSALRERWGGAAAAFVTTLVFLVVPGLSTVVGAVAARLVGGDAGPVGFAPGGQDPVGYGVLVTVFGFTLVAARTAVGRAPLWAAIGTHLTFLTVNRVALEGDRRGAGWFATDTVEGVELLVPVYLLVAVAGFAVCRRISRPRAVPGGTPGQAGARGGGHGLVGVGRASGS